MKNFNIVGLSYRYKCAGHINVPPELFNTVFKHFQYMLVAACYKGGMRELLQRVGPNLSVLSFSGKEALPSAAGLAEIAYAMTDLGIARQTLRLAFYDEIEYQYNRLFLDHGEIQTDETLSPASGNLQMLWQNLSESPPLNETDTDSILKHVVLQFADHKVDNLNSETYEKLRNRVNKNYIAALDLIAAKKEQIAASLREMEETPVSLDVSTRNIPLAQKAGVELLTLGLFETGPGIDYRGYFAEPHGIHVGYAPLKYSPALTMDQMHANIGRDGDLAETVLHELVHFMQYLYGVGYGPAATYSYDEYGNSYPKAARNELSKKLKYKELDYGGIDHRIRDRSLRSTDPALVKLWGEFDELSGKLKRGNLDRSDADDSVRARISEIVKELVKNKELHATSNTDPSTYDYANRTTHSHRDVEFNARLSETIFAIKSKITTPLSASSIANLVRNVSLGTHDEYIYTGAAIRGVMSEIERVQADHPSREALSLLKQIRANKYFYSESLRAAAIDFEKSFGLYTYDAHGNIKPDGLGSFDEHISKLYRELETILDLVESQESIRSAHWLIELYTFAKEHNDPVAMAKWRRAVSEITAAITKYVEDTFVKDFDKSTTAPSKATLAKEQALRRQNAKRYNPKITYAAGDVIIHWEFGFGTVVKVMDRKMSVHFDSGDTRTLVHAYG